MSEVTYKKIVDVEQIDALGEDMTLFVNDGGSMKQMGAGVITETITGLEEQVSALSDELKGNGTHQMLVTGADGSTKWDDRTHYEESVECYSGVFETNELNDGTAVNGETVRRVTFTDDTIGAIPVVDSYKVVINEEEYSCQQRAGEVAVGKTFIQTVIGNPALITTDLAAWLTDTPDTGEPFLLIRKNNNTLEAFIADTSYTYEIALHTQEIHHLDPKYLPEDHINGLIDSKLEGAGGGSAGVHVVFDFTDMDEFNGISMPSGTHASVIAAIEAGQPVTATLRRGEEYHSLQFAYLMRGYAVVFYARTFNYSSSQGNITVNSLSDEVYVVRLNPTADRAVFGTTTPATT